MEELRIRKHGSGGKLAETDAYALAALLVKAGYTVRVRYELPSANARVKGWTVYASTTDYQN